MRCANGHDNPEGNQFCGTCGAPVAPPASAAVAPDEPAPAPPPPPAKRRRGRKLVFALLALVVLAAGGAAAYAVANRESDEDRYLAALAEVPEAEFPTPRAAVLHAESTCEAFESTGDPKGGPVEQVAVEHYCPDWAEDFRLLETVEVEGTFTVDDFDEYYLMDAGDPCSGDGGYGDINSSTRVLVTNAAGDTLARTSLGVGEATGRGECRFTFRFEATEGEDMYIVAVGDRGEQDYSFDELKDGPALYLG